MVAATANKSTRYFVDLDSGGFRCSRAYRTLPVAAPNAAHQFKLVAVGPVLRPDAATLGEYSRTFYSQYHKRYRVLTRR